MPAILGFVFIFGLVLAANFLVSAQNQRLLWLFDAFLVALNLPLLLLGGLFLVIPADVINQFSANGPLALLDWTAAGWSLVGMGLWGTAVSVRPLRRWLGRLLPLQAESPVHTLALVLTGYLVGNTLFSLTQGGLEELAATAVSASIFDILVIQSIFALLALLGVGLYTRRSLSDVAGRLGLERPTARQLAAGVGWILALVVMQTIGGAVWSLLDSSQAELVENLTSELLGDIDTLVEWLLLAGATGTGEELLFRGALQPALGLGFTSLIFAFAHVQYGITPVTFVVFLIGIVLGVIRQRYNTTVAIFVHAGYNFVLGMMSLLALRFADSLG